MKPNTRGLITGALIASLIGTLSPAQAGIVGADAAANRARIAAVLEREDARSQLVAYGVDADAAKARVDALTDEEAARLAGQMRSLPAGGAGDIGASIQGLYLTFVLAVMVVALVLMAIVKGLSTPDAAGQPDNGGTP